VITVAILGGGFMGATHAKGWAALGDRARVKTVCSRSSERALKVAQTVGAELTGDLDGVLADPEVDVVDVCLPTALHREVTERALGSGKHVLLEKPIALTAEDAAAIARAAERSGKALMVAMVLRWFAEYVEIERRVRSGELGRALAVNAFRLSVPADWNDWMRDPAQSGGMPVDLMIHDFDQANWLLGEPRRVLARPAGGGSVPQHVQALVEYDAGEALVEGSMAMPSSWPFTHGIRVLCERGVVEHGFRAAPAEDGGNIGGDIQSFLRVYPAGGQPETVAVQGGDPWAAEIAYFAGCVEQGRAVERGTVEQAGAALAVALAANRSLASGQPEAV
jgi:predicted dehydrogenase